VNCNVRCDFSNETFKVVAQKSLPSGRPSNGFPWLCGTSRDPPMSLVEPEDMFLHLKEPYLAHVFHSRPSIPNRGHNEHHHDEGLLVPGREYWPFMILDGISTATNDVKSRICSQQSPPEEIKQKQTHLAQVLIHINHKKYIVNWMHHKMQNASFHLISACDSMSTTGSGCCCSCC
jgi:hypothetical protein